ncbi:phage terminase small subunit P27 family [Luteolibacter arcticus]|uniref:Phage terminase small subunit P27 family n=2 Tax=Luteolibacter arcticus TaxID=1581411 RepID=A0ABT3GGZ8_9BACT|nr:phage terminase small subunit P27 family [Luteolibacter arcticus]
MGARGTKPKENLSAMAGMLAPLSAKAPEGIRGGTEAEDEYERLAKELIKLGHLSAIHRQILVDYVEAWEIARTALDEIKSDGPTLENAETGNKYLNPSMTVWSMARSAMETAAKALGMTPLALQSIKNVKPQKPEKKENGPSNFLTGGE